MPSLYEKNLSVLEKINPELYEDLKKIDHNEKFEVFQGDHEYAINIKDTQTGEFLYQNPVKDLEEKIKKYRKLREYPFLYFFGVGNGFEIKFLLKNYKLERLIIIELEIELIYILLNLHDFSNDMKSHRLIILISKQLTFALGIDLFGNHKSRFYAKVFNLYITTPFYDSYIDKIKNTNQILTRALQHVVSVSGNNVTDSLVGVKHHVANLPLMLKNPKYKELIKKKNSDVAIIISTGPSLQKQLSLLKKIKDYATLISVDASLPILEKHGIKPDIVTSIERIPLTATFFENTSAKFQKGIICLSASLQHKRVIKAIKGTKVLAMRPFRYNRYFKFDEYGYVGSGMSAANLAHELAIAMKYKTCILIGQDLSFAKDGTSHSKDHVLGINDVDKNKTSTITIEAYGGKGTVESTQAWSMFKNYFEQTIEYTQEITETINATEGGAHISGSIEMKFENAIKIYIKKKEKKEKIKLNFPSKKDILKSIKSSNKKINHLVDKGVEILSEIEESFITVFEACRAFENKTEDEALHILNTVETILLLQEIEKIRNLIDENDIIQEFYYDILQSNILHDELELAKIKVRYIDNPKDNQLKTVEWILMHREWLFNLAGILRNTINIIKESKSKWDKTAPL